MTIERFTKAQFESVLPDGCWESCGVVGSEHVYAIPVQGKRLKGGELEIRIHSSVNARTGMADGTGENSIRAYLFSPKHGKPIFKRDRWTTRQPGWDKRLYELLREMYGMGLKSARCKCGELQATYVARTEKNAGRKFRKCLSCGQWGGWVD
jgi:hypothetical protein